MIARRDFFRSIFRDGDIVPLRCVCDRPSKPLVDASPDTGTHFDEDAGEASPPDARPFSIADPDFETPESGCGPFWGGVNVSLSHSTDAYRGNSACRVCVLGPTAEWSSRPGFISATPGEYFFGGSIKQDGEHRSALHMNLSATKEGIPDVSLGGDYFAQRPQYRGFGFRVTIPPDRDGLSFRIDITHAEEGACFLVDHLYLQALP